MEIKATVSEKDIANLTRSMEAFRKHSEKSLNALILKVAKLIARSAALWTKPSAGTNVKRLKNKDKLRPIEEIPESAGYWYSWAKRGTDSTGKIFRSKIDLKQRSKDKNPRSKKRRSSSLTRIKYGWKFWNKDSGKFGWIPRPGKKKKWDGSVKRGRIPSAGAARWGWMKVFGGLSGKGAPDWNIRKASSASSLTVKTLFIQMINKVYYASKISRGVIRLAMRKATNSLRGELAAKLKRDLKRKMR